MKRKPILFVAVVTLALGTGLILLHQLKGAEPAGAPGEPAGARGGVQEAASGPGAGTQPASGPAFDANDPDVKLLVKGLNEFAIDLYKEIAKKEKGNIFFSPFTISSALAITYAGARGKTAEEMAKVLHFPPDLTKDDGKRLHAAFRRLMGRLKSMRAGSTDATGCDVHVANGMWVQREYPYLKGFLDLSARNYAANIDDCDFKAAPEDSRRAINAWVDKQTEGKLGDLLPEGTIDNSVRMVIVSAMHFKGLWDHPFDEGTTRKKGFTSSSMKVVQAPMMAQKGNFHWAQSGGVSLLSLPYRSYPLSMVILLPDRLGGLEELERDLDLTRWSKWVESRELVEITLAIPKYRVSFANTLKPLLESLGLRALFSVDDADLSGMTGKRNLSVSNVVQRTWLEVEEKGTESASGTGVMIRETSGTSRRFVADHPFICALVDDATGMILVLGRVGDPATPD